MSRASSAPPLKPDLANGIHRPADKRCIQYNTQIPGKLWDVIHSISQYAVLDKSNMELLVSPCSAGYCSAAPIAIARTIHKADGTWGRCEIAGPDIEASKRKAVPFTFSPTINPTAASIATRPCVNSAYLYLLRVASSALEARSRGSQKSTGGSTPGRSLTLNAYKEKISTEVSE